MREKVSEQLTLLASIVKWSCYASIVGALSGCGTTLFLWALAGTTRLFAAIPQYYLLLPITLVLCSLFVARLAPASVCKGTDAIIEAVHQRMGRVPLTTMPVKLMATVVTIAGGGSAGKECPSAQIGAGLASAFGRLLRLDDVDQRKLVICGISAGFATVFGTPIAGALFGVEVLVLGQVMYEVLFPSFVAGIIGFHVASQLGVRYPHMVASTVPPLSGWSFAEMLMLGVWCGVIALLFIELMKLGRRIFNPCGGNPIRKAFLGGLLLALIGRFVSARYLGLGIDTIEVGLAGGVLPAEACVMKGITTAITLGCGGSGGVVTPIMFIGASAGNLFASLLNEPQIAAFSIIGMAALLAGAANTPIAASVMAMELFGASISPYAAVACMVSFLIVGYRSIYSSQVLGIQKSTSLKVETGIPLSQLRRTRVIHRKKSLVGLIERGTRRLRDISRHNRHIPQEGEPLRPGSGDQGMK
jgi:H+/Cl- antiporter ClcA